MVFADIAVKALMSMAGRLLTAEMLEWLIVWGAEKLAARTETPHDDEFVAQIRKALGR